MTLYLFTNKGGKPEFRKVEVLRSNADYICCMNRNYDATMCCIILVSGAKG